ncbi:hypothetical protein OC845_001316 [Tilletia horrida]|nr:hypothetical protein OC845_001316 [Tilletia horrida]
MSFSQQTQQQADPNQQFAQANFSLPGTSGLGVLQQGSAWFPNELGTQPSINGQYDATDAMTQWTPSYASVGGDGFASAYSASLADIAEEGVALGNTGGLDAAGQIAYDPMISDTYDLPQMSQGMGQQNANAAQPQQNTQDTNMLDIDELLGLNPQPQSVHANQTSTELGSGEEGIGAATAEEIAAFLAAHPSPPESSMSPSASSNSANPGSGSGIGTDGTQITSNGVPADVIASWARSGSFGQDKLNMAMNQVHISDELRYPSVFADDNDQQAQQQHAPAANAGATKVDQMRASLPSLNTSFAAPDLSKLDENASQSALIAQLLAQWVSSEPGLPSPAAAQAIHRAATFGNSFNNAQHQTQQMPTSQSQMPNLTLQTALQGMDDPNSLAAHLRNLTPVDGSFDLRSLAQPLRNESFEKIAPLLNTDNTYTPVSGSMPDATNNATAPLYAGLQYQTNASDSMSPKDMFVNLFNQAGLSDLQSQQAYDLLHQQAQGGQAAGEAQALLAAVGLIGEQLQGKQLTTDQWAQIGLKGFQDPNQRAAAAAALMGQDLTVMPMRYGLATSATRTQIGEGQNGQGGATRTGQQTMDPSLLSNPRESTVGPMRSRNWSSSGRARPSGQAGGPLDAYRYQNPGAENGPSYLGAGGSAHPYGAADALRRSASERTSARRHRRSAKSEDLTRMAQEGNADYVHRITSPNGMLAPPSFGASQNLTPLSSAASSDRGSPAWYQNTGLNAPNPNHAQYPGAGSPGSMNGNASDGTPSLDGSRSGGSASNANSPASPWTGSPNVSNGQIPAAATYNGMQMLAASAAGLLPVSTQQQSQHEGVAAFMAGGMQAAAGPSQYSQTAAPMYSHLVPGNSKNVHEGMLPGGVHGIPTGEPGVALYSVRQDAGQAGPANHVSAATQAASAARRKTEALFVCPVPGCGSTFTRKNNLDGHLRSHNNERPFACPVPGCDKRFARRHDMNRHHDLHTNKKQHTCELCNRRFARLDALNRHLKNTNGTCAATSGNGDDDDEEGEGELSAPHHIVPSSSSATAPAASTSTNQSVLDPALVAADGTVQVAISAPTPQADFEAGFAALQSSRPVAAGAQIPILVTPSRQNSGASSGGGDAKSRFRGHVL